MLSSPQKKGTIWNWLWKNRYIIILAIIAVALCIFFYPFTIAGALGILAYIGMGIGSFIVGAACGWVAKKLAQCHKAIEFVLDLVIGAAILGVASLFCPPLAFLQLYSFTAPQVTTFFAFCLGGLLTLVTKICRCLFCSKCCSADDIEDPIVNNDLQLFNDPSDENNETNSLLDSDRDRKIMRQSLEDNNSNEDDKHSEFKRPENLKNITISNVSENEIRHKMEYHKHSTNDLLDVIKQDKLVESTPSPLPNELLNNNKSKHRSQSKNQNRSSGSPNKQYKDSLDLINESNSPLKLTDRDSSSNFSQYSGNHFHRPTKPSYDGIHSESFKKETWAYKKKMVAYGFKSTCCCCFLWCRKKKPTNLSKQEDQQLKQKSSCCFPFFGCCNRDDAKPDCVSDSSQQSLKQHNSDKSNYINTNPHLKPITENASDNGTVYLDGYDN